MEKSYIGVIDSGVGGLSIYAAIKAQNPIVPLMYLADSAHIPYGTKSPEFITKRSEQLVSFLANKGITTIVIACNTITVTCLDTLRLRFPEITLIGTVPVIKTAAEVSRTKNIGVLSTIRTTESPYTDNLIKKFASSCIVTSLGTDELVPLVERGEIEGENVDTILSRVLSPFIAASVDTLALGCTHFPFLKPAMQEIMGEDVFILDSGGAVARQLMRQIGDETYRSESDMFFTTGDRDTFDSVITKLLHKTMPENTVKSVDIV